jgi:hypothetical protein
MLSQGYSLYSTSSDLIILYRNNVLGHEPNPDRSAYYNLSSHLFTTSGIGTGH